MRRLAPQIRRCEARGPASTGSAARIGERKHRSWVQTYPATLITGFIFSIPFSQRALQLSCRNCLADAVEHHHLVVGHLVHRPWNAADAIARLATPRKRHPIGAKRRVVVHENGGCVQVLCGPQGDRYV